MFLNQTNDLFLALFLSGFLAVQVGCYPSDRSQGSNTQSLYRDGDDKIISGTLVKEFNTLAEKSVVQVEVFGLMGGASDFCSAVLIDKRTLLTAAHCFGPKQTNRLRKFRVWFKNPTGSLLEFKNLQYLDGFLFSVHPEYNSQKIEAGIWKGLDPVTGEAIYETVYYPALDHDLAIAVLSADAPDGFAALDILKDEKIDLSQNDVQVFGFGRIHDYTDNEQTVNEDVLKRPLRKGTMKINADFFKLQDRFYITETSSQQYTCTGDSGGPVVWTNSNGEDFLVGITSAAIGKYLKNGQLSCRGLSQIIKVSPFYDWIQKEKKRLFSLMKEKKK
jgi:hypothetical protein